MSKYTISIDPNGAPKVGDKYDINEIEIANTSRLLLLKDYKKLSSDNNDEVTEVKKNLQGLAEAFKQPDISKNLVDRFAIKDANTNIKDTKFSKALTTLLQWKKQVIKAYVYVTVISNTGTSVGADANAKEEYDQLKEFMKESTRILLNLNILSEEDEMVT